MLFINIFVFFRFGSSQIVDMTFSAAREIIKCQKETGLPQNDMYATLTNYSVADGKEGKFQ